MSANLEELEQQQPPKKEELDSVMKVEMEKFLSRYCMAYNHKFAKEALEELLTQARTHR